MQLSLAENNGNSVVIGIIRETIGPFIDRSTIPDETITFRIDANELYLYLWALSATSLSIMP